VLEALDSDPAVSSDLSHATADERPQLLGSQMNRGSLHHLIVNIVAATLPD
jgi:hypothetical protein